MKNLREIVVYIVGPYRADTVNGIDENIRRAREVAKKYWLKGYAVICPHLNSAFMDGLIPDEEFLVGAQELLRRSDIVVLTDGWEKSHGSVDEANLAIDLGKTIIVDNGEE